MVIEALKQAQRQKLLAGIFVILLFLTFCVIFFGVLKKKEVFLPSVVVPPLEPPTIEIEDIDILNSQALRDLEIFKEPSLPEEKGRENPFLPYEEEKIEEEEGTAEGGEEEGGNFLD
jgi:hypothetical protein